jgi:hypothetical protein
VTSSQLQEIESDMKFALHFGNLIFPPPKDAKNLALTAVVVRFESIIAVEHVVRSSIYETKYSHNETRRLPGDMEMLWPDPLSWLTFIGGAIIIGGHSPLAAKRAAHLGDGFFPAIGTQTEIKPIIQLMHKEAAKILQNPMDIEITTGCPNALLGSQIASFLDIKEKISSGVSRVASQLALLLKILKKNLQFLMNKPSKALTTN